MNELTRQKPGPKPANRPKAKSQPFALYPVDRAAIVWFRKNQQASSDSEALRSLIDVAMRMTLGPDWTEKVA